MTESNAFLQHDSPHKLTQLIYKFSRPSISATCFMWSIHLNLTGKHQYKYASNRSYLGHFW